MRINTNLSALTARNALSATNNALQKTIQQLSTGRRINSASDDAAGLAISERTRAQTAGLDMAIRNAQDGVSLLQTADGALSNTHSILQRMRELAVQASNDTLTASDRNYIQLEIDELKNQVDSIANTTTFNQKRLLDGSCCGTWTSDDPSTKACIRGSIETEGNYRIEVTADPGTAQVQKSNIFRIKHEDVLTNVNLNTDEGIATLSASQMMAGDYKITATKVGGGETTYTYTSTATVPVTHGNDSGVQERIEVRISGNGNTATWSDNYNYSYYRFNISSSMSDPQAVADEIASKLDGKTVKLGSGDDAIDVTFAATADSAGNCVVTTTNQTKIENLSISFTTTPYATTQTSINSSATENKISNRALLAGRVNNTSATGETISITVTNNGSSSTIGTITVDPSDSEADISSKLQNFFKTTADFTLGGDTITLESETMPAGSETSYRLIAKNGSENPISVSLSTNSTLSRSESVDAPLHTTRYEATVTNGNTSSNKERITVRAYASGSSGSNYYYIDIDAGKSAAEVADAIVSEIDGKSFDSGTLEAGVTSTTGDYYLRAVGTDHEIRFSIYDRTVLSPSTSATQITSPVSFVTPDPEPEVDISATSALTGVYGLNAASVPTATVNAKTENNASILFEVVAAAYDESGKGTVTLNATSNVLTADGKTTNHTESKIVLSTTQGYVNLGTLLGEDDSNFSLTLPKDSDGNYTVSGFDVGQKFVYNISGNGSSKVPVDTSLYVTGKQDPTWPSSWGDTISEGNQPIQYNVNASSISGQRIQFRNFYLNGKDGTVHTGNITLELDSDFGAKAADFPNPATDTTPATPVVLSSFTENYVGKIATGDTQLRDIEQFWTKDGVFMLEEPQVINLTQADGTRASVTLYSTDTLNDVRRKLNDAIANDLGQGQYVSSGSANKFVTFVEDADDGGLETVQGTFLIRSLAPGAAGELTFSSSYGELIDALGLNTVQEASEGSFTASVYDAHTGAAVARNVKMTGNRLIGVVQKNVDVELNAMAGVTAAWNDSRKNFVLASSSEVYTTTLHLTKTGTVLQMGATEGDEIALDIGDMSAVGLGITGVNVMTHGSAARSITILDDAIGRVSAQRAKIGATQNSIEHVVENLTVTSANLTGAESRVRDVDMATAMMKFVKLQILNQSGTSMLAQANQLPQNVLSLVR